jgi:hypothetical protein
MLMKTNGVKMSVSGLAIMCMKTKHLEVFAIMLMKTNELDAGAANGSGVLAHFYLHLANCTAK